MDSLQIERLTTLGHAERMALFRLLVRRYPQFLPSGEIAQILDLKQNTTSVYLSALTRVGLLEQKRQGRHVLYRADMAGAEDLVAYLFEDCCRARPEICLAPAGRPAGPQGSAAPRKYNAIFICSGNSARSIFAEAILRDLAGDRFNVYSAGTRPAEQPHPMALEVLKRHGHDITALRSKHVSELQGEGAPVMDFVFTVCDQAANEECPTWLGQPITAHWGVPDPARAEGNEAERALAFRQAYGRLLARLEQFTALRPEGLERAALQARIDDISRLRDQE